MSTSVQTRKDLALLLSLVNMLGSAQWMSKDVVLLIASTEKCRHGLETNDGIAAWLDAYYNYDNNDDGGHRTFGEMRRAGIVRFALNFEISISSSLSSRRRVLKILTQGTNGRLPNLDLVAVVLNAMHSQCMSCPRRIGVTTATEDDRIARGYFARLTTMLAFVFDMIRGSTGPHGQALAHGIDALTISIAETEDPVVQFEDIGRAFELSLRWLSNAEESLHHSHFLYVMPSAHQFVSVEEYLYACFLLLVPVAGQIYWLSRRFAPIRDSFAYLRFVFLPVMSAYTIGFAIVAALMSCQELPTTAAVGTVVALLTLPYVALRLLFLTFWKPTRLRATRNIRYSVEAASLQMAFCIWFVVQYALAMFNFSFAIVTTLFGAPLFFLAAPGASSGRMALFRKNLMLALFSPLSALLAIAYASSLSTDCTIVVLLSELHRDWIGSSNLLVSYIVAIYAPTHAVAFSSVCYAPSTKPNRALRSALALEGNPRA